MPREITGRIETDRLILRSPEQEDLDGWAAMLGDERATRFLGGPQGRAAAWRHMAAEAGSWRMRGYGMYSVIEKATGRWIGRVGPHWPEGYPGLEVGWGIMPSRWRLGFATEAARAIIDVAFREMDCIRLIHLIDPDNLPSIRIAERLGAVRGPAVALPPPYDKFNVELWSLSRGAWSAGR